MFFYNPNLKKPILEYSKQYPATEIEYQSADGVNLFAWYTKPKAGQKVVVFLHGNSYDISGFSYKL